MGTEQFVLCQAKVNIIRLVEHGPGKIQDKKVDTDSKGLYYQYKTKKLALLATDLSSLIGRKTVLYTR